MIHTFSSGRVADSNLKFENLRPILQSYTRKSALSHIQPLFIKVMDFLFPSRRNHVVSDSAPPSFLRSLMASTNANAAAILQMLEDESHDNRRRFIFMVIKNDSELDDDERSTNDHVFRHLSTPAPPVLEEPVPMNQQQLLPAAASPPRKKALRNYARKPHNASHWRLNHLTPEIRDHYLADPHGRLAVKFRRLFLFSIWWRCRKKGGGATGHQQKSTPKDF